MNIINWIVEHQVVVSGFSIAFLDFIFAVIPSWESNGILHSIYLFVKGLGKPSNPTPPKA